MVRSGKCLLNDLHTGRCGEARVKREKKEYRHSFSPYTFCSCSSEMQRRLPVSRGHKSPRRNQGIRWLKEEDWESWSQVLWISQCGKKKKSWAVSLGWKRLKTENRTMGQKAPGAQCLEHSRHSINVLLIELRLKWQQGQAVQGI